MVTSAVLSVLLAQITITPTPAPSAAPGAKPAKPAPAKPAPPPAPGPDREVTVDAGKFDRQQTVVRFELPAEDGKKRLTLYAGGRVVPFQVDQRGRATLLLDNLKAGAHATYRLAEGKESSPAPQPKVTVDNQNPLTATVKANGKQVLQYEGQTRGVDPKIPSSFVRGGFIHPLMSPSGAVVTEAFPVAQPRYTGLFSFWQHVEAKGQKVDFWDRPTETGRITTESLGPVWSGPVHGGFEARQIYLGVKQPFNGLTLLHEAWRVSVYASGPSYFMFDLESDHTTPTDVPVKILKSIQGGIGVYGRSEWFEKGIQRLTSDGAPDAPRARWAYVGGAVNGKQSGVAVLSHPANVGAPQAIWRGFLPNQPFLDFVPNADKDITIDPGHPYSAKYRFVTLDGKPDPKLLERLWRDFAMPPTVSVKTVAPKAKKTVAAEPPAPAH
jgi:hypothetical protein